MKAGRPRWLASPRQVPITFESKEIEAFRNSLPRNVSLSEGIRELVKVALDEQKKVEAPTGLPILSVNRTRQTTISEYDIYIFQNPEQRMNNLKQLSKEQRTKVAIEVTHLRNQIDYVRR